MTNIVLARVKNTARTRNNGAFANAVRMWPGEEAYLDLDELGIESLDGSASWELVPEGEEGRAVQPMPIAPIAPHASNPEAPQMLPSGARITGTGGHTLPGTGTGAVSVAPMAPEKAATLPEPEPLPERSLEANAADAEAGEPTLLDESIPTLRQELAKIDDVAEVRRLREQEVGGKSRTGALEALDDRIFQLEEKQEG